MKGCPLGRLSKDSIIGAIKEVRGRRQKERERGREREERGEKEKGREKERKGKTERDRAELQKQRRVRICLHYIPTSHFLPLFTSSHSF